MIEPGTVVRLKSGSTAMTVLAIDEEGDAIVAFSHPHTADINILTLSVAALDVIKG